MSRDDPHARRGRVDEGVADHELLEDVVLDRPRELLLCHALLLGRDDVQGQDRQHGAVHRHRHTDVAERDVLEQDAHVEDAVDGDAGHADVGRDAGVVASHSRGAWAGRRRRQPLLAGGQVAR